MLLANYELPTSCPPTLHHQRLQVVGPPIALSNVVEELSTSCSPHR